MKIGEMMRQEGNAWQPAGRGELAASTAESAAAGGGRFPLRRWHRAGLRQRT